MDTNASAVLGFGASNVRALESGVTLPMETELKPGWSLLLETAANIKGIGMPRRHRVVGWLKKMGATLLRARADDHERWSVSGETVQVNYKSNELDLASAKALTRVFGVNVFTMIQHINARKPLA